MCCRRTCRKGCSIRLSYAANLGNCNTSAALSWLSLNLPGDSHADADEPCAGALVRESSVRTYYASNAILGLIADALGAVVRALIASMSPLVGLTAAAAIATD